MNHDYQAPSGTGSRHPAGFSLSSPSGGRLAKNPIRRMTPMTEILLTSALTITGGILVIVCGQICIRFFIEPVHELQKAIGDVGDALIYHANLYRGPRLALARVNPSHVSEAALNASVALRQKAVLLGICSRRWPWIRRGLMLSNGSRATHRSTTVQVSRFST
jgi:hypothetical protein